MSLSTISPWNPVELKSSFTPESGCVIEGLASFKKSSQSEGKECEEAESDSLLLAKEADLEPEVDAFWLVRGSVRETAEIKPGSCLSAFFLHVLSGRFWISGDLNDDFPLSFVCGFGGEVTLFVPLRKMLLGNGTGFFLSSSVSPTMMTSRLCRILRRWPVGKWATCRSFSSVRPMQSARVWYPAWVKLEAYWGKWRLESQREISSHGSRGKEEGEPSEPSLVMAVTARANWSEGLVPWVKGCIQ